MLTEKSSFQTRINVLGDANESLILEKKIFYVPFQLKLLLTFCIIFNDSILTLLHVELT